MKNMANIGFIWQKVMKILVEFRISAYRWDFFSFSKKWPVLLFGTLENLYFKTKIGVAGLMLEPHPPNFENLYIF